jgi:hypothetical protein
MLSLSHHVPENTTLGKAKGFNQVNNDAVLLTTSMPYDKGTILDQEIFTVQIRLCSQLFTNLAKHHAWEE